MNYTFQTLKEAADFLIINMKRLTVNDVVEVKQYMKTVLKASNADIIHALLDADKRQKEMTD